MLLQFENEDTCVSLPLDDLIVLGRGGALGQEKGFDLSDFGARDQGVSRRHCLLRRHDHRLVITDLDSLNGTFLNGDRLTPRKDYVLCHGDRLALSTLVVAVYFGQG